MREVIPAPVPGLDLRREYGHHQSPAIRAGGMVFCSGMVAIDPQNGERQHGTVTSEARRIFEKLKLLLASTGSSLDRLVQVHATASSTTCSTASTDNMSRTRRRPAP